MNHNKIDWYYIICTTVVAFLLGTILHFVYDWTGGNQIVGLFCPVNESIWEHLKLILYPVLILWLVTLRRNTMNPPFLFANRMSACLISILIGMVTTASLYYLFHGGFRITLLILDLLFYAIGLFLGQLHASILTFHRVIPKWVGIVCLIGILALVGIFAYCTFYPLELPIFKETIVVIPVNS